MSLSIYYEEGWQQVRAGIALIVWSRLASWDTQELVLVEAKENEFESAMGHEQIHNEFGRLICWIAFSVGSEYLAKGVCLLNDQDILSKKKNQTAIRPPLRDEDIESWIALVNNNDVSIREPDLKFETLANLHVEKIVEVGPNRDLVEASIKLLASAIRNRDAHRYARNVRAFHFHTVKTLFVPAFNILLKLLNQEELRRRLSLANGAV